MNCPICKSNNVLDLIYRQGNFKCSDCGHLFKYGIFDYTWYKKIDYWYKDSKEHLLLNQKSFYAVYENFIVNYLNALEIGAADGDFLSLLTKKINYLYYNELVDNLRPEYKNKIQKKYIGDLKEIKFDQKFKNIFLNDVIEHFDNPKQYMDIIYNLLEENGRLFLLTNNGDFLNAHNEIIYHNEHCNIFTRKSFDIFIQEYNFKKILHMNTFNGLTFIILEKV
jgi:SAM-dependent methyltransferase